MPRTDVLGEELQRQRDVPTVLEVVREHEPGLDIVDHIMLSAEPGPGGPGHEQIDPPRRS